METKKKKVYIISMVGLLLIVIGASFAFFTYNRIGSNSQQLITGNIYMKYNGTTTLQMTNVTPSDTQPTNYFQFTIEGVNTSNRDIVYDINVVRGDLMSGKTESQRIADKFLSFTLKRSTDGTNYEDVITNQSYSDISNGVRLYVGNIDANTSSKVTYYYRLYAWVNDEVIIYGGRGASGDYLDTEWPNMFATVKVKVTGDFTIKATDRTLSTYIASKVSEDYITAYEGNSNDTYDGRGNQTIYYYNGSDAKANSNVLFAGYCWQIIRTTDNGGVKLLYNGVAENNQCKADRSAKKGINGEGWKNINNLDTTTTYGTGFTYTTSGFTLTGTVTNKNWENDHEELIGMFTCGSDNISCTTISHIGRYESSTSAKGATYSITSGNVADKYTIGTSPFNGYYDSLSGVGYMYNKVYKWYEGAKEDSIYANDVTYANGVYTLGGTTEEQDTPDENDNSHHYVCHSAESITNGVITCSQVRYYITFYNNVYRYIILENGEKIEDAIYNMTNYKQGQTTDANLNVHNSSIKAYLDSWYAQNLNSYASYIDTSTTYCNDRTITSTSNLGGWNKTGALNTWLYFINSSGNRTNLSCGNLTDRFSVENTKAKLTYPIGLITDPERQIMNGAAGDGVEGKYVWGSSPYYFYDSYAGVRLVASSGAANNSDVRDARGARPVVSLRPDASFSSGDGSYDTPYVVGPTVTRTIS